MSSRANLHAKLEEILGSTNVYFQSPASVQMKYPAIVYKRSGIDNTFANDAVYGQIIPYEITVIDKNPESEIVKKVSLLPKCKWDRNYTADNLNHDVFTIYY